MKDAQTTYANIKYRCTNPKDPHYKYYGGRGIKCKITLWQLRDLWERDKANLMEKPSIDRIDSNKDYTVENCRFIEMSENSRRGKVKLDKGVYSIGNFNLTEEELQRLNKIKEKDKTLSNRYIFLKGLEVFE